jgi:NAD-dependent deacetylase sirtuin 4
MIKLTPFSIATYLRTLSKPTLKNNIAILTGAGISTDSGLPDYRGPQGLYKTGEPINHVIHHNDFMKSDVLRKRYWLRSVAGFERFALAKPNRSHYILAELEQQGIVSGIVTQNVDRFHTVAGSQNVVELHGRGDLVQCMNPLCGYEFSRRDYQKLLVEMNEEIVTEIQRQNVTARPDFDSEIPSEMLTPEKLNVQVKLPCCPRCSGEIIKPSFVFFGGSVEPAVADAALKLLTGSRLLLIMGTTTQTLSSYRAVVAAAQHQVDIGIVNLGTTRADHLANLGHYNGSLGDFLQEFQQELVKN